MNNHFHTRDLEEKIFPKYIESDEIIVITGMRRVGKTTLCKSIYEKIQSPNKIFLDIENPINEKIFEEEDYSNIIENLRRIHNLNPTERIYIFLDEIQASPNIVNAIKYLYDHFTIKFILTGSSSFYLKNSFPESLAGRKKVFELFPLSFKEFLTFKGVKKDFYPYFEEKEARKNKVIYEKFKNLYEEFLNFGGFPGVVTATDTLLKKERLEDIFKSYFEKEVKILSEFRDVKAFRDLMLLLLQRIGSKLDISKLKSELGIGSRETVNNYIAFLESTYFIHSIPPYSTNLDREVSGAKKIFVCDTGIANNFAKLDIGHLFENSVYLSLRNQWDKICYYQKRDSVEIDFIVPDEAMAFEAKTKGIAKDFKTLKRTAGKIGITKCFVLSKEYSQEPGIIPATEF